MVSLVVETRGCMCNCPQTQVTSYSRANIGGVRFRCKRLDTKDNGMPKSSVGEHDAALQRGSAGRCWPRMTVCSCSCHDGLVAIRWYY
jgi:hypothetical protein